MRSISRHTGSQEPECDKRGVSDTFRHTIIPHMGTVVMINAGLAQAHPNNRHVAILVSPLHECMYAEHRRFLSLHTKENAQDSQDNFEARKLVYIQ